jgi:uncharacterized alkaline shock family protein YloU
MESESKLGKVMVAPEVLLTVVRQTTLSIDGVVELYGTWPENIGKLLGIHTAAEGIAIQIEDDALLVDVHIIARPDAQMVQLGRALQEAICRSVEDIVGLDVEAVNVHIEDVDTELEPEQEVA